MEEKDGERRARFGRPPFSPWQGEAPAGLELQFGRSLIVSVAHKE
jgi:hypothetical protein